MEQSEGFAPIASPDASILILGSLPGQTSLQHCEYYAHAQNAFWPIMRELYGIEGTYGERCAALKKRQLALWDVLQMSVRRGSLDADIRLDTAVANDFETFLGAHNRIRAIVFNGRKAEQLFRRFVLGKESLQSRLRKVRFRSLPSTSPAYAAMPFSGKLDAWKAALDVPEIK